MYPALQKAAEAHSEVMIDKDYSSHTSQDGTTFFQRIKRQGYNYRTAGENIAWGSLGAPDNTFKNWMNSPATRPIDPRQELPRGRHKHRHRRLQELR